MNTHLFFEIGPLQKNPDGSCEVVVGCQAEHEILKAHFPDDAIVPGVCLLDLSRYLISAEKGEALEIREIHRVKFMSPIRPNEATQWKVCWTASRGATGWETEWVFTTSNATVLKARLLFETVSQTNPFL